MTPLDSQVVLITGGANGIGAELARRLHARGAALVLTDLDEQRLARLVDELSEQRVLAVTADVRDRAAMQSAAEQAIARFGGIDTVVANAGIGSFGSVLQVDPDEFRRLIDVNVLGVYHTVRAALPTVIARRGYVLIVSSLAAYTAAPGMAAYHASKAAVEQFADVLRLEVANLGVDVGSAHMSWIDTALVADNFTEMVARLPYPLNRTTSVQQCARAFVRGIERRKRRIYSPAWVGLVRWLKPALASRPAELLVRRFVADLLARMDDEMTAPGP